MPFVILRASSAQVEVVDPFFFVQENVCEKTIAREKNTEIPAQVSDPPLALAQTLKVKPIVCVFLTHPLKKNERNSLHPHYANPVNISDQPIWI